MKINHLIFSSSTLFCLYFSVKWKTVKNETKSKVCCSSANGNKRNGTDENLLTDSTATMLNIFRLDTSDYVLFTCVSYVDVCGCLRINICFVLHISCSFGFFLLKFYHSSYYRVFYFFLHNFTSFIYNLCILSMYVCVCFVSSTPVLRICASKFNFLPNYFHRSSSENFLPYAFLFLVQIINFGNVFRTGEVKEHWNCSNILIS